MRRIFIAAISLLLSVAIYARSRAASPASPAATGGADPLVFVFLRVDQARKIGILRPMIAPDIGVQLEAGPRELQRGAVLYCIPSPCEHDAVVDSQAAKVTDLVLECGEHKFVVKSLDFHPSGK